MKLSNMILKRKLQGLLQSGNHERRYLSYEEIRTMVVFVNASDFDLIYAEADSLRKAGKKLKFVVFGKGVKEAEDVISVSGKQFISRFGLPTEHCFSVFKKLHADVFVDLTADTSSLHAYLYWLGSTFLRIGIGSKPVQFVYDIELSYKESADIKSIFEQILFYLRTIRAK